MRDNCEEVLVATDFSADADRAVQRAGRIAEEQGAKLRILHVLSRQALEHARDLPGLPPRLKHRIEQGAQERLERFKTLIPASVMVETIVRFGTPKAEILRASATADVLVLGARGANPLRSLLLGTTAERILSKASTPILIVKLACTDTYRRVLVPVDFSEHSKRALSVALEIAPAATFTVVHAFHVPFEGHLRLANVPERQIADYRSQEEAETRRQMDELLSIVAPPQGRSESIVSHGAAIPFIQQCEEQVRADLIVIGKHGHSKLADAVIGSVTRRTIATAQCDVLVVPSRRSPQPGH
jgi:nucleotide-binding universal stress UspA family protein